MLDEYLPEEERLCSADVTGELLWALETLWKVPGLASLVRGCSISASLPIIASALLDTAARLDDPFERPKKVELENYIGYIYPCQEWNNKKFYTFYFFEYFSYDDAENLSVPLLQKLKTIQYETCHAYSSHPSKGERARTWECQCTHWYLMESNAKLWSYDA